jgi:hypothetical protein
VLERVLAHGPRRPNALEIGGLAQSQQSLQMQRRVHGTLSYSPRTHRVFAILVARAIGQQSGEPRYRAHGVVGWYMSNTKRHSHSR